jgi:3-deoxy-manno-octulosonate cytidylyltransferase (CMP-KDO synthetase)
MIDFIVAIPARYASSRLPGKPLSLIGNKPMIVHVAECALAAGAKQVVIATDDERVADAINFDNVEVCLTSASHQSGTDRLAECASILNWSEQQIVVNLQGDEPFAPAAGIRQVAELLDKSNCEMATLACPIISHSQFVDPHTVKVVRNSNGNALYFSRAPIPWPKVNASQSLVLALRHIGIYAYRANFLKHFSQIPASSLEQCESLEQLRAIENGYAIAVEIANTEFPAGVDTPEDLETANSYWNSKHMNSKSD